MLWTILAILVFFWLIGLFTNVVGGLIHIVLVIAGLVLIAQLLLRRRSV